MPYIQQAERANFDAIENMPVPANAGQLNYAITRLILRYLDRRGHNYQQMNEIVGVLDCAKHELQRRIMDPYEDHKMTENGDVL